MIISVHLRKCAGTTFRTQLQSAFQDRVLFDYGDEIGSSWPSSIVKRAASEKKIINYSDILVSHYNLIHGHFYKSKYDFIKVEKKYITFLRHPVQRVLSNYFYLKRNISRSNPDSLIVNKLGFSLEEYIRDPDSCNLQAQYLESTNLDEFDFVGIVERYDESIQKLSANLGVYFERANAANVNPKKQGDYKLESDIKKLILKYNHIDYELYKRGIEKLNGRY